ncbi:aldehyde dehydrogenase family protein [Armatimonas rosea]|uniref:Aldehyde dehydrogenase (NAD+) n=1 Tax=Armatimonas rosea TaxID=685828 RepID=A0A7W9SLS9_ARMRO|nr:aldehyde dehydrogenase family protein [Armatimonas rosea]MBB6048980.1 aldehyde dehydrogenase (NAD+) [Armatimonas rosea]
MTDGKTNFINGEWVASQGGATFASTNPANTDQTLGVYARSDQRDVAAAVAAAKAAYPTWRKTPAPARGALLTKVGRLLEERKELFSQAMVDEMGKVLVEARGDVQEAIDMAHYMAAFGRLPNGSVVPSERPDIHCSARRVPVGVVGLITPWNFPIAVPTWKMFPALLAGNTVVWKPAEDTPGMAVLLVQLLADAGIPAGVVNLVTGYGEEAGAALVEAEGVATISFTGSTSVGKQIAGRCGQLMKRVSCELGGKNAIVVLDDADIELAIKGCLWSAFGTAGQRCTAASRLIVDSKIKAHFTARLVEETGKLRMAPGADPAAQIGPVVNRTQLERIQGYVAIGQAEGATVLTGGTPLTDAPLDKGCFYAPTIFDNMRPPMRIAQEEIFGPVTGIITVDGLDEALAIANGTGYGLSLSLYTANLRRGMRALDELESGIVYINLPTSGAEIQLPFGGVKNTGNGHREAGWMAMDWCTEWKAAYINYAEGSELVRAQIDV